MPETVDQEIRTLQSIFWSERDPDGLAFAPLADAFRRKGEVREALDLLTDGMARHPDYATGHVVATRLYVDQGMHSEAELAARRVLELDPENLVALSALVSVLSDRGDNGEAARHKTTLFAADPDSEEARAVADIDLDAAGVDEGMEDLELSDEWTADPAATDSPMELSDELAADPVGAEPPLELVSDKAAEEPPEITEIVPEGMYQEDDTDTEELDRGMADELAADPLDLTNLSFGYDEEAGIGALAPDDGDDEVVEMAALAPDEEDDEVVEMAALAPDDGEDDEVVEMAALAPDEVTGIAALAPDDGDEEVADIAALAPDEVTEIAALAPDGGDDQADEDVVEVAALAPEASVEELAEELELAATGEDDDDEDSTEPIYTRTLADLYIKQGFHDKALEVLKHIQERQPDATDLAERIAALETGEAPESGFGPKGGSTVDPAGQDEDDLERRARELAEAGEEHAMDTPFAWSEADEQPGDAEDEDAGIGDYLEGLLEWENRSES